MKKGGSTYGKLLKPLKNRMVLILIVFSIWMLFLDRNSWFIHNELNQDIDKLEQEKEYYQKEIEKDQREIKELSTEDGIEKYGREHYKMKKEEEDIYLIEYEDSTAKDDR